MKRREPPPSEVVRTAIGTNSVDHGARLEREMPELITDLSPEDGKRTGIANGEFIRVSSRRGTLVSRVELTERVKPGMIFMPLHF